MHILVIIKISPFSLVCTWKWLQQTLICSPYMFTIKIRNGYFFEAWLFFDISTTYLYFQVYLPNTSRLFGSTYMITFTNKCPQRTSNHNQVIYITKHHIKALDQPTQRCDGKTPSINTSACIADFIEKQIGCNTMIQGSQYSTGDRCSAKSDLLALANMTEVF